MPIGHAASVPISTPFADPVPPTCDPNFWDVLKDRAWMEGQRQITQNNNLIARPDSVLSLSCFDSMLNHLSWYAGNNFPGNPGASRGGFGGVFTDIFIIAPDTVIAGINLLGTDGFLMYAVLELLVLDQLSRSTDTITRAADITGLLPCTGKEYFINRNFPHSAIGGRGAPLNTHLNTSVSESSYNGCSFMNQVWNASKCYNFNSEPSHDGFYSLKTYRDSGDYRTKDLACSSPKADGSPDLPSILEFACDVRVHGVPSSWNPISLLIAFIGNNVPTWSTAFSGSNPAPGSAGSLDSYLNFLNLRNSAICASLTPIKTGLIVTTRTGKYADAVCPAPGCYFNPPATIAGNGTCN